MRRSAVHPVMRATRHATRWRVPAAVVLGAALLAPAQSQPPVPTQAVAPSGRETPGGRAGSLIAHFHMQRVPEEGPWFSRTYSSEDTLEGGALPARYGGKRHLAGSAIMLLETAVDFSALHRLQTDETWHFYGGSPIELLLLYPDGHGRKLILGADVAAGELPQFTVPHGVWQGSSPRGRLPSTYSFAGDQLSPAFDPADFEMGYCDALVREYPAFASDIARLTRGDYKRRPERADWNHRR